MASYSIKRRPNGMWRARYRDPNGREHAKHERRKVDAQQWLERELAAMHNGTWVDPKLGKVTFASWFDEWVRRQPWEAGTRASAATVAKSVTFGGVELTRLRTSDVQTWVKAMQAAGLQPSTIKLRFNFVRMAMLAAVNEKIVRANVTDDVKLPVKARASKTEVRADQIPTPALVHAALDKAPEHFRGFVAVCALAGLRLGEAAGLRVVDVDFDNATISIKQQVQGTNASNTVIAAPKYGSERDVHVSDALMRILRRQLDEVGSMDGLMFTSGTGMFNRNSASHQWRELRKKIPGLESFTLHSLRHFFASGLINAGCDVAIVQQALGHSTPAITLNTYTHLWPKSEDKARAAATALAQAVLAAPADSSRTEGRTP